MLKGHVQDRAGAPIGGVRVTVLDHPELGVTNTRADGAFDLAVNGGGVTLSFVVAGFLPVQRTLSPNWQDYETLDDVVMVPVDPNVKTIDPDSTAPFQVVRGTETEDKDGERQGTLLFPKGVDGAMELPNGRARPLDELKVRVTEFTYGEQGDEAMPGSLPANSGYTYAAEFSVDEALKAGATQVNFDKPLINYTENFIGAPVGSAVPTGYYDRETAEWKGAKNGRVIKVLSEANGIAAVDTDGDGKADTGLGMTDDERKQLASLYEPGQELWRVLITHFTPVGPQLALRPAARRASPPKLKEFEWKDPNDPCQQKGSAIGCETQTLQESVPVTGTGMTLNYSTDRTPGWKVDETIEIPVVGPTIPPRLKGIQLTIDVAGEKIEKRWCDPNFPTTGASTCKDYPLITPNISFPFRWDGKDAYDRTVQGRVTATIQVIYVYEFNYYGAETDELESSFSQFGSDTEVFDGRYSCGNRSGTMDTHFFCGVPVGQTITRAIGSWDARTDRRPRRLVALRPPRLRPGRARAAPRRRRDDPRRGAAAGRQHARGHDQHRRRRRPRRRELPEGRRARDRGQHRLHGRLRPLARRQPLPPQRPQPQRHLPHQPRRQDLPVRRQRLQGPGDDGRRRPGQGRRPRRRLRARGRAGRRAADRLLQRRQLRPGDPRASARTARRSRRSPATRPPARRRWATASPRSRRTSARSTT